MRIDKITNQMSEDFWADFKCEHCGHIEKNLRGYNDIFFHENIIPEIKCKQCEKTGSDYYRTFVTTDIEKYCKILMDLVLFAETEKQRENLELLTQLFKNKFKKDKKLMTYVWQIDGAINELRNRLL